MKTSLLASSFILALGLGTAGALAQAAPAQPSPAGNPPAAVTPVAPTPNATEAKPAPHAGFVPAESGEAQPQPRPPHVSGASTANTARMTRFPREAQHRSLRHALHSHSHMYAPQPSYEVAADKRRLAYRAGYRQGLRAATVYSYRRPVYRHRAHVTYVTRITHATRVTHAYAETPFAYDLPRETYATGIFPTTSAIGLHSYDYAYTTRIRPVATYAGATGSYAGGYPIYNRPLAPAYPTCPCY